MSSANSLPVTAYTQTPIPLPQTPSKRSRGFIPESGMSNLILQTNLHFVCTDLNTILQNTLLHIFPLTIRLHLNLKPPLDALEYTQTHLFFLKPRGNGK